MKELKANESRTHGDVRCFSAQVLSYSLTAFIINSSEVADAGYLQDYLPSRLWTHEGQAPWFGSSL